MHSDWLILPLLLPTPTIWFSLDHKRNVSDGVVSGVGRKWKRSDSSDSDSVALTTPLTTPIFDFHEVISALTTPTPSLVKTSLKYFSDTKFVYRKLIELLVFAWTKIVTHLLQEFSFSQNVSALIIFNFWSASHDYCTSWET